MTKSIKYLSAILTILFLIYTLTWLVVTISISHNINKQYADQNINITSLKKDQLEYYIKFSKISSYGFPFKIGFQITGWQEEGESTLIEFLAPIYIGYDFLKQSFFINFSGKAVGHYKPVELKFGSIFNTKDYSATVKMPLSIKLFRLFSQKKDVFELVNFIKEIRLQSNKTQVLDLYDQKKLYEEDYTNISFSFEKSKYYTHLEDFKNNVPQKLNFNYSTKITESNIMNRKIPAGLFLYRFAWPFTLSIDSKFYIKTNQPLLSEFHKDFEVNILHSDITSDTQKSLSTIIFRNKIIDSGNNETYLKINSKIGLKAGFSDSFLNAMQYLLYYTPELPTNLPLISDLKYINDNKEKFSLTDLENRQYLLDTDIHFIIRPKNIAKIDINNLSLFSNNTGFRLSSELKLGSFQKVNINGVMVLNNYTKPTSIIANYLFNLGKFKTFSDKSKNIYKATAQHFLKSISDYPDSTSEDISFEYSIDSDNIKKAKIGSVDFDKIVPLYYLALYKEALKYINPNDVLLERMSELIPDFNQHQELLQQLMIQPFKQIDNNVIK
ncbi:MAG: hypothetical protein LN588_01375 [Rickettsia endosymbiont of Bryobia graminum]|nr:hypothetical protein [Rickettsia endosymbiont of Bryobia graminum]